MGYFEFESWFIRLSLMANIYHLDLNRCEFAVWQAEFAAGSDPRAALKNRLGIECRDRDINAALNIKNQGALKLKAAGLPVSADGGKRNSGVLSVTAS